jgi:hypothetical protein
MTPFIARHCISFPAGIRQTREQRLTSGSANGNLPSDDKSEMEFARGTAGELVGESIGGRPFGRLPGER